MFKKLVINAAEHETRVALLEDGDMAELFVVRKNDSETAGNIYKGRVQQVLPGMQAAFVDIGLKHAAFIHVTELLENKHHIDRLVDQNGEMEEDHVLDHTPDSHCGEGEYEISIENLITENQQIMVQMVKSPIGTKGARITSYVSLPGRFLVLMPDSDHIGISRRIEDECERDRLKHLVATLSQGDAGYIVRTAAQGAQQEQLAAEMRFLAKRWQDIQTKFNLCSAPAVLHEELPVSLRTVRDLLIGEADRLVVDSVYDYETILTFLDEFAPERKSGVELYQGEKPIFDYFNLEQQILGALKKKVWLKSGGYIVIEHTEALVAIDVNTGRYVGEHDLEETILKINLEAVNEIVHQIRLRDLGGIIVIDFIDMKKKANQENVFNALKEELKKDRRKTHVLPMSEMGLIQMTRKRSKKALSRILCEACFHCEGNGALISRQTICNHLYRQVLKDVRDFTGHRLILQVNPEIAASLKNEENHLLRSLARIAGKQIVVYPNERYPLQEFVVCEDTANSA